eukprot:scaffold1757_cov266-Pinguiococcus_pyrenoidosus.AAC.12
MDGSEASSALMLPTSRCACRALCIDVRPKMLDISPMGAAHWLCSGALANPSHYLDLSIPSTLQ